MSKVFGYLLRGDIACSVILCLGRNLVAGNRREWSINDREKRQGVLSCLN